MCVNQSWIVGGGCYNIVNRDKLKWKPYEINIVNHYTFSGNKQTTSQANRKTVLIRNSIAQYTNTNKVLFNTQRTLIPNKIVVLDNKYPYLLLIYE